MSEELTRWGPCLPCLLELGQQLPACTGSQVYHHTCKPHTKNFTGDKCGCVTPPSLCLEGNWGDITIYPISLENIVPDYQEEAKDSKRGRWQLYTQNSGVLASNQSQSWNQDPVPGQPKRVTSSSLISQASLARLKWLTKSAVKSAAKMAAKLAAMMARKLDQNVDSGTDENYGCDYGDQSARSDSEATIASANQRTEIRWIPMWRPD